MRLSRITLFVVLVAGLAQMALSHYHIRNSPVVYGNKVYDFTAGWPFSYRSGPAPESVGAGGLANSNWSYSGYTTNAVLFNQAFVIISMFFFGTLSELAIRIRKRDEETRRSLEG